jgi:hypothetical protein
MHFYTYVNAYDSYQKLFILHSPIKKLPHMSADIKVIFLYTDGYQVQTPEKYTT